MDRLAKRLCIVRNSNCGCLKIVATVPRGENPFLEALLLSVVHSRHDRFDLNTHRSDLDRLRAEFTIIDTLFARHSTHVEQKSENNFANKVCVKVCQLENSIYILRNYNIRADVTFECIRPSITVLSRVTKTCASLNTRFELAPLSKTILFFFCSLRTFSFVLPIFENTKCFNIFVRII